MNNKPVAWRKVVGNVTKHYQYNEMGEGTPLYTHPVNPYQSITNTKIEPTVVSYTHPAELTDEEIANTWDDVRKDATLKPSMKDIQDFARAILRKAQEK